LGIGRDAPPPPAPSFDLPPAVVLYEVKAVTDREPELVVDLTAVEDDDDEPVIETDDFDEPEAEIVVETDDFDDVEDLDGEPPRRQSTRPPARDPRRESDEPLRAEIVRVPEMAPRAFETETRSVIVDMGAQVQAQVDDLLRAPLGTARNELIAGLVA